MDAIKSKSGKILLKVATRATTPTTNTTSKEVFADQNHDTIEIIVSDSRAISRGSQFGHTAIVIDGQEYGRAHPGWDTDTKERYLHRQQVGMQRDSWGYVLRFSPAEKKKILAEIRSRMAANEPYSAFTNSCSSNIAEVLEIAGIQAYDARWSFGAVSPADLMVGLKHSRRLVSENVYPKK
ncbi:DUF4105 domain-containing protein [Burkholderia territorii]|uniref:lipoprotein N-acyltransferase Lnb domain-containing protein n=1 Tax=Burkholderia territorii TaxID=1503055 RepID=UPI0009C0307E|nr:DUF4105 domain-containing protein [Burkholderia territorii]